MSTKYRILVVEDEVMIRRNIIKKIKATTNNFIIIGEASDGEEALGLIEAFSPHLVITDIRMPIMDGLELLKSIYFAYPPIQVVIISGYNDFEYARVGMHYGAKDFLLKPVKAEALKELLLNIEFQLIAQDEDRLKDTNLPNRQLSSNQVADYAEHYVRNNYHTNITVADLADKLGYSSDYIGKVFKKHKKETLLKFITKLRIQEAKQLLKDHPELEIQDIGTMVGYTDPFYFSRVFKKNTSKYPSEYR